jgi:hypothetical protein
VVNSGTTFKQGLSKATRAKGQELQLARLVERVNRNFDDKRQTGAVFLDVAKAFDILGSKVSFTS